MRLVYAAFLLALIVLAIPAASSTEYSDISYDGSNMIYMKTYYLTEEVITEITVGSHSFNVTGDYYSVDGDGDELYLVGDTTIDEYSYQGEFEESYQLPTNFSAIKITLFEDKILLYGYYYNETNSIGGIYEFKDGHVKLFREINDRVSDMDAGKILAVLVGDYNKTLMIYDMSKRYNVTVTNENATFVIVDGYNVKLYDMYGNLVQEYEVEHESGMNIGIEPKPVTEVSTATAAAAATGGGATYLSLIYVIRERHLTSLANVRKLRKKPLDLSLLALPVVGFAVEILAAPNDRLTRLAILGLSIGGGYSLYLLVLQRVPEKRKRLRRILVTYGLVASTYGLISITRRRSVATFYALTAVYALYVRKKASSESIER